MEGWGGGLTRRKTLLGEDSGGKKKVTGGNSSPKKRKVYPHEGVSVQKTMTYIKKHELNKYALKRRTMYFCSWKKIQLVFLKKISVKASAAFSAHDSPGKTCAALPLF